MSQSNGGSISIGDILSNSFGAIGRNPLVILGSALLFVGVPLGIWHYVSAALLPSYVGRPFAYLGPSYLVTVLLMIPAALAHVAIQCATVEYRQGNRAPFGECLRAAVRLFLPLFFLNILTYLSIGLGLVLLVVPGILIALSLAVVSPVLVVERSGVFEAFGRSQFLTNGHRWKIFGLFLIVFVCAAIIAGVSRWLSFGSTSLLTVARTGHAPAATWIVPVISSVLISTFNSVLSANLYVSLKEAKEGPEVSALAEVFA